MNSPGQTSPRVCVIVPVFDVEDHIADCIAALRAQSGVAYEVIVVDDGARDASAARAEAAMAGDSRFRLIRQDNRGLSAARNTGLAHTTAPLIAFVDGDDQVAPDFLWQMVDALDRTGGDWVACAIAFRNTDPGAPGHGTLHSAIHGVADLSRHGSLRRYPLEDWRDVARHFPSAWNKLYRRDLIEGLCFPEGTWFEDHEFYWQTAARTDHIIHLPQAIYIQTRGRPGQITAQDDDRIAQQFDVLRRLKSIIDRGGKSHGAEAFAHIASRLLFERSTVLRHPERRARHARDAALFLREHGLSYTPDWDPDIALTFGCELAGHLPLSVIIPWNGTDDLTATLAALAALHGPGREVLVVCDSPDIAARADLGDHLDARAVVQPGQGPDPARNHGLACARGAFVLFLRAGDTVLPGAVQVLADRLLQDGADLGVMGHIDPQDRAHQPFFRRPPDPGSLTPADLIELRPVLSATLFRRQALQDAAQPFGTAPHGDWSVLLRAAHAARSITWLDWPGVRLAAPSRRPLRMRDLLRGHAALIASVPPDRARGLHRGWEARLFARALHDTLLRADTSPSPRRKIRALAAILAARPDGRSWGAGTSGAVFDPDTPRALRRFVTAGRLARLRLCASPVPLQRLSQSTTQLAADLGGALFLPLRPGDILRFRARFDRKTRYANLGLLDRDGTQALLHISLQPDTGKIACNDFRDGHWGEVVEAPFQLRGRDDVELSLTVAPSRTDIALDGRTVLTFGDGRAPVRFTDLGAVRHADPAGGIDLASVCLARVPKTRGGPTVSRGQLVLDDRLILRGGLHGDAAARLEITGGSDTTPPMPIVDSGTHQITAALPGRLWRDAMTLTIRILDDRDGVPPVSLTVGKADILARLETLLTDPDLPADPEAAMLAIEHARFAELSRDLSPTARAALDRLVRFYGLGDFLPPAARDLARPIDGGQVLLNAALSRTCEALAADPPPDADAVLAQIILPRPLMQTHLLDLAEAFTCDGRDPAPLFRHARRNGTSPFAPGPDIWRNSAMLPFLWDQGQLGPLVDAIRSMEPDHGAWYATSPLAWVMGQALSDGTCAPQDRDAIATGFMEFVSGDVGSYPRRAACRDLTRTAADLVARRDRLIPDLSARVIDWAAREFGLSRCFWDALSQLTNSDIFPTELAVHRQACAAIVAPVSGTGRDEALRLFDAAKSPDAVRFRRDLGAAADPGETGSELLRRTASPGAPTVPDAGRIDTVRRAMRDLYVNTPQSPDADLQMRIGRRMAALSEPVPDAACAALLSELSAFSDAPFHHLGLGLALRLAAMADQDGAARVDAWLTARNVTTHAQAPAIRSGLSIRNRARTPLSRLHDIIVVVVSCRANLETRIPAMRHGWLGQLAAKGIPYIVVTGDGDGQQEGDVVHLDAPDDYEGLPQKVLAAIDWVRDRTQAGHMLKVDDDCFVEVDTFFDSLTYMKFDYHGRLLSRLAGHMDRAWHMTKSRSQRGRFELDRSPEPSIYADGGTGYTLSRHAMEAVGNTARSVAGRRLIAASFMEDKMLGDLLRLAGIGLEDEDYHVTVRRRTHSGGIPVPIWVNGFDASAAAPVKLVHLDTHLDQKKALSRRASPDLTPAKIWPSFLDTRLGYLSHALEMVTPADRIDRLREVPVAVVAVMRNEMFLLPHFLDHYRRLGVGAFAIADNLSDDGTLEYLAAQPDVAVFSVDTEYRLSQYGVAWQQAILSAFRVGRWSLLADADELLVWQADQTQTLTELLDRPDFADADAARIFMLDMYPEGPLSRADFAEADPFTLARFCDARPFLPGHPGKGPFSNSDTWTSALRHRLIPGSRPQLFVAQKYALLRYHPFLHLSAGLHYVGGARHVAARELLFGHFKYNADFRRKALAEVSRGQHFNNAEEYRRYLALTSEGRETVFETGVSAPWTDSPFVRARLD